jgi:uncharacterized protein (DUF736 family)
MAYEKDPAELGALWAKTSAKGVEFLSGTINGVEVVCFKNTKGEGNPKAPAWRVLKSQPRDGQAESTRRLDSREGPRLDSRVGGTDVDF